MEKIWNERIAEVYAHMHAGDLNLAVRRMIDCALDTEDMYVFAEVIDFCKKNPDNEFEPSHSDAIRHLLEKIQKAGITNPSVPGKEILHIDDVSKSYAGGNFKVSNVTFTLKSGEIIGLVGENGNGKTTLLRMIATELTHDTGTINYSFTNTKDLYHLKTQLVYIEQRIPRWHGPLLDNLQFMLAHYGIKGEENVLRADMMLARMGLLKFKNHSWTQLSSGYRTRFEIARTLLRKPKILLLDEPLANLDILAQQTILQDLKYMASSLSAPFGMLLSSQHIYEVEKVSNRNIFLRQGTPQYQENTKTGMSVLTEKNRLIFEIEADARREQLQQLFAPVGLEKIQYNGGVFMAFFNSTADKKQVLSKIAEADFEIVYFRNITNSSRRFFIN